VTATGTAIIADHTAVDRFAAIPSSYLTAAAALRQVQACHPNWEGSIRLGQAFWWLSARLAGWDGVSP
jgi:hypothetical protein